MAARKTASDTVECPACSKQVDITEGGFLAVHDRTPDPIDGQEQGPEHCRWSGEPTDLVVG